MTSLRLALLALLFVAACRSAPKDTYRAADGRLHDAEGRELFLHGINARVNGLFDVTFDDGRTPLEPIPVFTEEDCRFLAEELGLDHLRLPVNWSGIEKTRGTYDEAYLGRVLELVDACARHDVHTLVDFHQDAYSKEIGEDGAPLWAIVPPPTMLLEGPLDDLGDRRTSLQVLDAFSSLYDDVDGVRTAYANMAAHVAARLEGRAGVVGIELQNEPVSLDGDGPLDAFHAHVGGAVRRAAPTMSIFFEPNGFRNLNDSAPVATPIPFDDAVYAPHVYVDVFESGWSPTGPNTIEASVDAAADEARDHRAVLYVGEFGSGNDANGLLYASEAIRVFDEHLAGFAFWLYEEYSQGGWGLYGQAAGSDPPTRGALHESTADVLARAYPVAIAGHVESFLFDPGTKVLTVHVTNATNRLDHVLAVPRRAYPNGANVSCDGVDVAATVTGGRARFRCAGATITLTPR